MKMQTHTVIPILLRLKLVVPRSVGLCMRGPTGHNEISYKQKQTSEKIFILVWEKQKLLSKILNRKFVTLSMHPWHIGTTRLQAFPFLFQVCAHCGYAYTVPPCMVATGGRVWQVATVKKLATANHILAAKGCQDKKFPYLGIFEAERGCDTSNQALVTVTKTFFSNATSPMWLWPLLPYREGQYLCLELAVSTNVASNLLLVHYFSSPPLN